MTDMDRAMTFWWRWLMVAAIIVLGFGLALVLLAGPMQRAFEMLYFAPQADSTLDPAAAAYTTFLQAILGSVMIGWAVLLLYVIYVPFRRLETSAWNMIAASLIVWFVPDTAFSLWSGFWQNVILNTALLAVFAIPLAATYGRFHRQHT
jgi:hypothetical protein